MSKERPELVRNAPKSKTQVGPTWLGGVPREVGTGTIDVELASFEIHATNKPNSSNDSKRDHGDQANEKLDNLNKNLELTGTGGDLPEVGTMAVQVEAVTSGIELDEEIGAGNKPNSSNNGKRDHGTQVNGREFENKRTYDVRKKLKDPKFASSSILEMDGEDFTLAYVQRNGFDVPVFFESAVGLEAKLPALDTFSVESIRDHLGDTWLLEVKDTETQLVDHMTLGAYGQYWGKQPRTRKLCVNTLEFSHTTLESAVEAPLVVRQLDWTERAWPRWLIFQQTGPAKLIEDMSYPVVRKYVHLSVKGCFQDFRFAAGGATTWYYVSEGEQIIFLIRPSEITFKEYRAWFALKEKPFFGDSALDCCRIRLTAGNVLFIPSAWLHAVYTLKDSVVLCGYFLHSYAIGNQMKIVRLETLIRIGPLGLQLPERSRYPFLTEMLWYVLARYTETLLGHNYICGESSPEATRWPRRRSHVHLVQSELMGIKRIVMYLYKLSADWRRIPQWITKSAAMVKDVKQLVRAHEMDDPALAVTGRPVLLWPEERAALPRPAYKRESSDEDDGATGDDDDGDREFVASPPVKRRRKRVTKKSSVKGHRGKVGRASVTGRKKKSDTSATPVKLRRRQRCKECQACQLEDCGTCVYCLDMTKFGGPQMLRKPCRLRQCTNMILPNFCNCAICGERDAGLGTPGDLNFGLFECVRCGGITHKECFHRKYPGVKTVDRGAAAWECGRCVLGGGGDADDAVARDGNLNEAANPDSGSGGNPNVGENSASGVSASGIVPGMKKRSRAEIEDGAMDGAGPSGLAFAAEKGPKKGKRGRRHGSESFSEEIQTPAAGEGADA